MTRQKEIKLKIWNHSGKITFQTYQRKKMTMNHHIVNHHLSREEEVVKILNQKCSSTKLKLHQKTN